MSFATEAASERTARKLAAAQKRGEASASGSRDAPTAQHTRRIFRNTLQGQSAWERHQQYVARYLHVYDRGSSSSSSGRRAGHRNDWDVLKERHRFLRDDDDDGGRASAGGGGGGSSSSSSNPSYEDEVARKYYQALFKDLVLADFKHYKSGNYALRWRSEGDVIDGIGQFTCANIRCDRHRPRSTTTGGLASFEINFGYLEPARASSESRDVVGATTPDAEASSARSNLVQKSALVKLVLCKRCSRKLHYKREQDSSSSRAQTERATRTRKGGDGERRRSPGLRQQDEQMREARRDDRHRSGHDVEASANAKRRRQHPSSRG